MLNLSHLDKSEQIAFRCPKDWKKEVRKAAIDRGDSVEDIVLVAVSKFLKIPLQENVTQN